MEYELVGPLSFEQIVKMESEEVHFSDLPQTIGILREAIDNVSAVLSPLQERIFYGKVGNIITSTPVKSIPGKGIYLDDSLVPFGFRELWRERRKKEIFSHPMLKLGMSGKILDDFWSLLWKGKMEFCISEGRDSGSEWESRALFDIDYQDDFIAFFFDGMMHTSSDKPAYHGFLIENSKA